jgi:outer membrane receptor protein involved in Fe transport
VNNRNNRITSTANRSGPIIGTYSFGSIADFANGNVADSNNYNSFAQSFPTLPTVHLRVDSLGFYAQDEWKALNNLNVTYGARFEYQAIMVQGGVLLTRKYSVPRARLPRGRRRALQRDVTGWCTQ